MKTLTLILGGSRSGKSAFAQGLAGSAKSVLFVATAEALDADMAARIQAHQRSRPVGWTTLEEPRELAAAIPKAAPGHDLVVIDCLTLWVSNLLLSGGEGDGRVSDSPLQDMEHTILARAQGIIEAYQKGPASWVVVSNEVGLGIVPPTALGREYRDALGRVNQAFAAAASQVYLLVAGLAVDLTAAAARPWRAVIDQPR